MKKLENRLIDVINRFRVNNPAYDQYVDSIFPKNNDISNASIVYLSELIYDYRRFYTTDVDLTEYFDEIAVVTDNMLNNETHIDFRNPVDAYDVVIGSQMTDSVFTNTYLIFLDTHDENTVVEYIKNRNAGDE